MTLARIFPKLPSFLRSRITTRPSSCKPTAAKSPLALTENWRGFMPPAGARWALDSFPVAWSMVQTMRASEGSVALLFGSKLGIWKLAT